MQVAGTTSPCGNIPSSVAGRVGKRAVEGRGQPTPNGSYPGMVPKEQGRPKPVDPGPGVQSHSKRQATVVTDSDHVISEEPIIGTTTLVLIIGASLWIRILITVVIELDLVVSDQ